MGPGLHVYNKIMYELQTGDISNYVVKMQSQLCKAMHGMGIMETQLKLTRKQAKFHKKESKDVIVNMVEEKSQAEFKAVNELIVADGLRKEVETKRKLQHDSFFTEKCELMEKLERQNEATNNSDGSEDEEENEEEKEELQAILKDGKEEIKRLEREMEKERRNLKA